MKTFVLGLIACFFICLDSTSNVCQAIPLTFQTIALSGEPVPGTDDGSVMQRVSLPIINNSGQLAFSASITSSPDSLDSVSALIGPTPLGLGEIIRAGAPVPGLDGAFVSDIRIGISFNDEGQLAFVVWYPIEGQEKRGEAVLGPTDSGLGIIARTDQVAPGFGANVEYLGFGFHGPVLNDAGQIAFWAGVSGEEHPVRFAIMGPNSGGLGPLAVSFDLVPEMVDGSNFYDLGQPMINNSGAVAFAASLTPDPNLVFPKPAWFGPNSAGWGLIAREDGLAAGFDDGTTYNQLAEIEPLFLSHPQFNDLGQIAFSAILHSGLEYRYGLFGPTDSGLGLVAESNAPAPGLDGSVIRSFGGAFGAPVILNDVGEVAFVADVAGELVIYQSTAQGVELVMQSGETLVGHSEPVSRFFLEMKGFNVRGDLLICAQLDREFVGVNEANDDILLAYSGIADRILVIAREGDLFDVNAAQDVDDFRTIESIFVNSHPGGAFGSGGGLGRSLNDRGDFVFQLSFTDGSSGIFVAQLPMPEPNSAAMVLMLLSSVLAVPPRRGLSRNI